MSREKKMWLVQATASEQERQIKLQEKRQNRKETPLEGGKKELPRAGQGGRRDFRKGGGA